MEGKLRNIVVAVFMMLCISQNCFALNIGVTNVSWFVWEGAHPGETLSATAVIKSFETETKHFSFTTVGYDETSQGSFACGVDQNGLLPDPGFNLASWVDFQGADFYIAPNETISVPFNITIPPDAFPGGHAGCFVIQEIILPDPCLGVDMCVLTRQGTRIYLTIDGSAQRITDNSYSSDYNVEFVDSRNAGVLDKFLGPIYYQNIGTKYSPNFTFVTNNYTGIPYSEYLQFADIDTDGSSEILLANPEASHQLFLYKNIGTPLSPSWALANPDVVDIGSGYIRLPALYDIDGNGNLDLFLATIWGPIFHYRNDGDRFNANWTLVSSDYLSQYTDIASYDVRRSGLAGPKKVAFIDIDSDGIKEMIVGGERGLHAFKQASSPPTLTWTYMPQALDFLGTDFNCHPTAVDLYGKGAEDLFASCQFGQYIYELNYKLSVQTAGNGSGTITSSDDSKINCGSVCSALYGTGVTAVLTAIPADGSTFTGWTGDCSGTSTQLDVLLDKGKSCSATFVLNAVNADDISDIFLVNTSTGVNALWFMNGDGTVKSTKTLFTDLNSAIVGTGDFNGDGIYDLIKRNTVTGQTVLWFMNADGTRASYKILFTAVNSNIVGTGDFNGDGICDLLKRDSVTGQTVLWFMNADGSRASYRTLFTSTNSTIVGTGDFNGDGICDLMKRDTDTGRTSIWFMNADGSRASYKTIFTEVNSTIVGTGDFNNDGICDLLKRNSVTGQTALWFMNADGTRAGYKILFTAVHATIGGTGDYNGDGICDLIKWDKVTGQTVLWFMNADGTRASYKILFTNPALILMP